MTKEELENEAEEWLNKWELCNKCENKVDCISNFSYCKKVVLQSYLASAEPREKQIQIDAEQIRALQKQNGELTDELTKKSDTNHQLVEQLAKLNERCSELEEQIEKMKSDVLSLIKDRMNDDIDQNIIERLAEKWEIKEK